MCLISKIRHHFTNRSVLVHGAGAGDALRFERVRATEAHLTLTDVVVTPEALEKHGITPEKLAAGGVPLATELGNT